MVTLQQVFGAIGRHSISDDVAGVQEGLTLQHSLCDMSKPI
jgi:hypothetical protein